MKSSLEYFAWHRPIEGYVWEDSQILKEPFAQRPDPHDISETRFLRWRDAASQAAPLTPLFDNPTLFREFATLDPTEDSFLGFANRYGWLGVSRFLRGHVSVDENGKKTEVVTFGDRRGQGEPLWRWKEAHLNLWRVNGVLQAIGNADIEALREWFKLSPDAVRYERDGAYGPEWSVVCGANQGFKPYLWKWGSEGRTELDRLKRFASIWAQKKINEAIGDADNGTGTSVRVLLNDVKDGMAIHIVPDTLLGAMWLQCARVLTENPTFKACENCGKWFELSPDARRKNSKYCSDRCKVAAHRARAIIPTKCESCDARFTINVAPSSGFSYMNHQDVTCPKCGAVSHRLLPGEFIGVTVRGKRQMVKAHT